MVFAKQIVESKLKKKLNRIRMESEGSDGHGHSKNQQKSSGQGYSSTLRYDKSNEYSRPTFPRCGKKHEGRFLIG